MEITTPYKDFLPPLATDEREALRLYLETGGDCDEPVATEDGRLLDGHHRRMFRPDITVRVIPDSSGWSDARCRLYISAAQRSRRNMSWDQEKELLEARKRAAWELSQEGWTQAEIATQACVSRPTVTGWLAEANLAAGISIVGTDNANTPPTKRDGRVRVPKGEIPAILQRLEEGETQSQVAADYGVTQSRIAQILKQHSKRTGQEEGGPVAEESGSSTGVPATAEWSVVTGDCCEELAKVKAGSARLVFADPPYNIGIDYGQGQKADLLASEAYCKWFTQWLDLSRAALSDDGSLWILVSDDYAAEYVVAIKRLGLVMRNWIKWYEKFGVNCVNKFNRTSRHLLYFVKHPKRFVFHADCPEIRRPSDRQTLYQDARANQDGKLLDDVWEVPRVAGTFKERIPGFPTQVPLALLRRVILCCTDPGDLVIDPFNGSGSTGVMAISRDRRYLGIEKSADFAAKARQRLSLVQKEFS